MKDSVGPGEYVNRYSLKSLCDSMKVLQSKFSVLSENYDDNQKVAIEKEARATTFVNYASFLIAIVSIIYLFITFVSVTRQHKTELEFQKKYKEIEENEKKLRNQTNNFNKFKIRIEESINNSFKDTNQKITQINESITNSLNEFNIETSQLKNKFKEKIKEYKNELESDLNDIKTEINNYKKDTIDGIDKEVKHLNEELSESNVQFTNYLDLKKETISSIVNELQKKQVLVDSESLDAIFMQEISKYEFESYKHDLFHSKKNDEKRIGLFGIQGLGPAIIGSEETIKLLETFIKTPNNKQDLKEDAYRAIIDIKK